MDPLTNPTPRPVAIGYVSSPDPAALDAQRDAVTDHARAEGYALAHILADRLDGYTISQVVETARLHKARLVIVPAGATLATAHAHLAHELEPCGAVCVVIDDAPAARDGPDPTHAPATAAAEPATATSRLTDALGRHVRPHTPRHAASTGQPS
ncbi:hypothetical protein [Myceligenerans pegani]|uniref:Resolvase/invertase-type recombinase catalytic domain-containing protein n=1 Tax=Myceligenerans pegani TaxID=2776917 RepID=A0ABR9MX82_9MICO|nr:hypothetical protein [Myceligenerans sp. TRM 65318]MBE1875997.1 hypothetical protein [Myceligenerans sp. TRM 65318]MBE3018268.1 hypothetical protein [Myceligenerans sp. TRM 65318]